MSIPLHKPWYDLQEEQAILASLRSGRIVGDGENTRKASALLADLLGVRHVLLTTSCTHALELAMMVLDLQPGDEVIMPSFTFVSTANCVMRERARPVFADILPATLTLDAGDVERKISPRTRAFIPVGYAGVAPEMDALLALASRQGIAVVEDAAHAVGARYKGRAQGTIGDMGCLSFHETKNLSTGEGGAFVTNNGVLAERAEILREKGTNRKQFLMHLVDKYTWVDVGSSFLPTDLIGALLCSQLAKLPQIQQRRSAIHNRYMRELASLQAEGLITLPTIPEHTESNYHLFYVLMTDESTRNDAIAFFGKRGIGTAFHYIPLHLAPVGRKLLGFAPGDLPVTESISSRILRLPLYPTLGEQEQGHVIETMKAFFEREA